MKQLQTSSVIFAGAAVVMVAAQPVWAKVARVTAVQLNPTSSGLNLVLQTSTDARPQMFTSQQGKTLLAYITNAQLSLPQGNNFRQNKPAPGIDSIVISQVDSNSIRLVITGTTSTPSSRIADRSGRGITLSINTAGTSSATPANVPRRTLAQTPTQKPLVPNPEVTIDGAPSQQQTTPVAPAPPPVLPRAIAPPVGDIAVSNTDSSPALIDLGSNERVPRLVLRDAPVREVLSLLARAAGLNLAYTAAPPPGGQQGQQAQARAEGDEGPRISLDIQDESVQDVFNYVLRISGLQANREGRTIFVGPRLPNEARSLIVRSMRMNQVTVGVALNFLVAMGAESAVSRERVITSVQAVPVGGAQAPATQTQTSTETRIETQRIDFQDSVPLLRGLQVVGDERTNSLTLIGNSKQINIATAQLIQLDSRRRQVAVNVKIVDVNLLATEDINTSFSFGIGDTFFSSDGGAATLNFGNLNPPNQVDVRTNRFSPPVTTPGYPEGADLGVFFDPQPNAPFGSTTTDARAPFGRTANPLQPGISEITPGTPATPAIPDRIGITGVNPETGAPIFGLIPGTAATLGTPTQIEYTLPDLFQFPRRFLSRLQAQIVSGNAKVLTDPTLIVQEGQQANVNLTQQVVGNITRTITDTTGGSRETLTVEKEQVGLTLSIRIERIDDNGFVALSVAPVVRAPQAPAQTPNGQIFLVSERSLNSGLVRLRDSQTLILSGIIQDSDRTTVAKVPILGDIPILGALFRSTSRQNQRQEVIVLLTPQILDDSERSSSRGYNYTPSPDARQLLERNRNQSFPAPRNRR